LDERICKAFSQKLFSRFVNFFLFILEEMNESLHIERDEPERQKQKTKIYGTTNISRFIRNLHSLCIHRRLSNRQHQSHLRDGTGSPLVDEPPNPQGAPIVTAEELHDAECEFTRSLLCGMIQQAVADLQSEKVFLSRQLNEAQELDRESAIHFIRSKAFQGICDVLALPADKIKTRALKNDIITRPRNDAQRIRTIRPRKDC
jgi:hypothetical protein